MSAPPTLEQLKSDIVRYAHKIAQREWVANHDGNLSVRLGDGRFLCTPTAVHKGEVDHSQLIVVDAAGAVLAGDRKPFSEWDLHRAIYEARPDVQAVIHAHPPTATGFAVAGLGLPVPVMAEPVVSLGAGIPLVAFYPPKSIEGAAAVASAALAADALLLENHGVITAGPWLELAYLRLELCEHQAKIQLAARALGGAQPLPAGVVASLLEARHRAGLSAPGEAAAPTALDATRLREVIAEAVSAELSRRG